MDGIRSALGRGRNRRGVGRKERRSASEASESATEDELAELVWQNLEKTQYVNLPASFVFSVLISYMTLGGVLFSWLEGWAFFDACYFSIISILKVILQPFHIQTLRQLGQDSR